MRTWLICTLILSCTFSLFAREPKPENIVVLANKNLPKSRAIAEYYMQMRNIPKENLIELDTALSEEVSWKEFVDTVFNPLLATLVEQKWIEAHDANNFDLEGRINLIPFGHKIDFLVVCKGIPLKIAQDQEILDKENEGEKDIWDDEFEVNYAAVDSELALLAYPDAQSIGYIENPLFRNKSPSDDITQKIILVARLDGPSETAIKRIIDNAIIAEQTGLQGRAYIDLGPSGPDRRGNRLLEVTAAYIDELGFDLAIDYSEGELIGPDDRFDAPAIYFGCWTKNMAGPIAEDEFLFPPGAIGVHLHSTSAQTLHSHTDGWVGPLVAHGITATLGNVYEPEINLSYRIDLLLEALAAGHTLGEAAFYALPVLSWQGVLIGDPLYRPFKVDLKEQLQEVNRHPTWLGQYAVIRKMRLLEEVGLLSEAVQEGKNYLAKFNGLALALLTAKMQVLEGDPLDEVLKTLAFTQELAYIDPEEQVLASDIAKFYASLDAINQAIRLYIILVEQSQVPKNRLEFILPDAMRIAWRHGEALLATKWADQLSKL
ncbi:MAG: hypothetical protein AUJ82_02210 [Verrucomicrobia bacterium CG1_02_43_26]|nr:MAG: hypothetical protein AUJ82_02210 [Verrucomicrobia bacterium CG1_02_43_26]